MAPAAQACAQHPASGRCILAQKERIDVRLEDEDSQGRLGAQRPVLRAASWYARERVLLAEAIWPLGEAARNITLVGVSSWRIQGRVMFVVWMRARMGGCERKIRLVCLSTWCIR